MLCYSAEVVEAACGIAPMLMGETVEDVAGGIDCYSIRQPIGVSNIWGGLQEAMTAQLRHQAT
jgi:hypothetical protein